jgi:uncharacterized protein (TIGR03437 family)
MIRIARLSLTFLYIGFAVGRASAQPQVNAVTNAADYTPTLSPGAIAALFGTGLAPSPEYPSDLPLPTLLNSVSVTVNGKPAPLFYISDKQINFQVPFETRAGVATLSVNNAGQQSNPLQCVIAAYSLGMFEGNPGYGVVQNADHSLNSSTNPAASGSVIVVYITGIGATDSAVADGAPAPGSPPAKFAGTATATIGDVDAPVQFIGLVHTQCGSL